MQRYFYMGSQIFGNLIAAFVLGNFPQIAYVLLMLGICIVSTSLLYCLRQPEIHHHIVRQETMNFVQKTLEKQRSLKAENKEMPEDERINVSVGEGVKKLLNLLKDIRFIWLIPQTLWTGASIAYFSGNLVEMLSVSIGGTDQDQFKYSMLAMVLFGLGQVLGCFFIGFIVDRLGSRVAVLFNLLIILIMSGVTIAFILILEYNALAFIMCFMWGFQDSAMNTHTQEILGFEFNDNYTPFSLFNIWQSISCFSFQLIIKEINGQSAYLWFTIAMTIMALTFCGVTYWFPFREEKAQSISFKTLVSQKFSLAKGRSQKGYEEIAGDTEDDGTNSSRSNK